MYLNGEQELFWSWTLQELLSLWKNVSDWSCSAWTFLQKSQWWHSSISSRGEARRLRKFTTFKFFILLKCNNNKWTFRLKAANTLILWKNKFWSMGLCLLMPLLLYILTRVRSHVLRNWLKTDFTMDFSYILKMKIIQNEISHKTITNVLPLMGVKQVGFKDLLLFDSCYIMKYWETIWDSKSYATKIQIISRVTDKYKI